MATLRDALKKAGLVDVQRVQDLEAAEKRRMTRHERHGRRVALGGGAIEQENDAALLADAAREAAEWQRQRERDATLAPLKVDLGF